MGFLSRFIYGCLLFLLGQVLVWYQINGQFLSEWAKERPWLMSVLGIPISYAYIWATHHLVVGFGGELWPSRLIGFAMGMIAFAVLTYVHFNQAINLKTGITLVLALAIVLVQVLWK